MPIKLIHHAIEALPNSVSPFDEAITRLVQDEEVLIACPYLNLDYLLRIFKLGKSVRLLTDAEEWLASQSSEERQKIQSFLEDFGDCVHHIKDLHAKVIIAGESALVGSANFTLRGLTSRTEMSVLFEQEAHVEELRVWFDELWKQSSTVTLRELDKYLEGLPPAANTNILSNRPRLTSLLPPIRSQLVRLDKLEFDELAFDEENADIHQLLVERVRLFPSRDWADSYFDLMKEVFAAIGLDKNDPRLVTSIPKSRSGWLLPLTINQRYVLAPKRKRNEFIVGIIFGAMLKTEDELDSQTAYWGRFDPLKGESEFSTPYYLRFKTADSATIPEDFKAGWIRSILEEVNRAKYSSFHYRFHQPLVYEAAVNTSYRKKLLDEAFKA
ncbi:MAG: phospholipase D family protein [Acidobacteria bacterium]|nr:phospholipase D family protein [Acidobacteriota bacterium]